MHLVILLLVALAAFIALTLSVRRDPDKRNLFYLFIAIDLWLGGVFLYLLLSAILEFD